MLDLLVVVTAGLTDARPLNSQTDFFGSRGLTVPADAWKDQVFSRGLPFYLFDLPFYAQVLGFVGNQDQGLSGIEYLDNAILSGRAGEQVGTVTYDHWVWSTMV